MSTPAAFSLLETMRWTPGEGFPHEPAHLARLGAAAAHFGFSYDEGRIRRVLREAVAEPTGPARVRLTLAADGTPTVTVSPFDPEDARPLRVALYPEPVVAGGKFWRHKTTHRPHYEGPYRWAQARGLDDALLADADGQLVEATRASVWIERDGRLLTPPLSAGGLPGIARAALLESKPNTAEAHLTVDDLREATEVYLSNAVRRLVRAEVEVG